ncbi:hypothetical protein [uncultured Chryseobacterium sp.]|uniref:hypothetical protein n=1 Tax=uncultured Chryseobacterium sp. TaxID=259322 RepID=UPI00258BF6C0|nr:hypothetical protein [uncultured Chryseobacterium sp.]
MGNPIINFIVNKLISIHSGSAASKAFSALKVAAVPAVGNSNEFITQGNPTYKILTGVGAN